MNMRDEHLIPPNGGFRNLKTFQISTLIYDVTAAFTAKFLDKRSRTVDQMVQAARSGRQNIAEGSVASGTSKKVEMKLTGIAKASLEELRLDYEDFLRQRGLQQWEASHPSLKRFKALRCSTMEEFKGWAASEHRIWREEQQDTDQHGQAQTSKVKKTDNGDDQSVPENVGPCQSVSGCGPCQSESPSVSVSVGPCRSVPKPPPEFGAVLIANGALSLLNLCIYLLDKQLRAQAAAFTREGGFTERLHRTRTNYRGS